MKKYENKNLLLLEYNVIKAKKNDKNAKQYIIDFFEPFIIKMCKKHL
ncbi:helix-turn-helix domain-containing protein [Clostridium cuniculi]|nr:helix-turn-helix domain-containing protein [Clostridium cuniculi]